MRKFLQQSESHRHLPLFTFHNGKYLTRRDVSALTKSLLRLTGANPTLYSSHSYRIGTATTAAAAGISEPLIQTLGRWQSTAYKTYIRSSPKTITNASKQSESHRHLPLFTFHNGKYLTRRDVSALTKSLLRLTGANPALYSSHSYRIGAATTAAAAGISEPLIQTLGRWQSTAYKTYIRSSPKTITNASKLIAHHHHH